MAEVTANYDQTWKEAISTYLAEFLIFFYPNIYQQIDWNQPPISLDKELEQITASAETEKRYADKLFKVWLLDSKEVWVLIHVEVQSQYDKKFPQRMFIYKCDLKWSCETECRHSLGISTPNPSCKRLQ